MNKNIIALIATLLIVGIGAVIFIGANASEDALAPTPVNGNSAVVTPENGTDTVEELSDDAVEADHTVIFTDNGYEPAVITVNVGESVAFINQSSQTNWTASDPHPTHTDLPSFDARRGIAPGEAYVYTFEEAGEWGYHDHQNSRLTGTVIAR